MGGSVRRSISTQGVEALGGPGSVLARQKRDHVELEGLLRLRQLPQAPPGPAQEEVLTAVRRLVFSHAFAEEAVLWPLVRRVLPDGEELTLRIEQEHQEINELMTRVETLPVHVPDRGVVIDRLVEALQRDVRDEEDVVLPRLQAAVSGPELRRLGCSWEAVRRTAPTRAHPPAARRPPGNALAAVPLTVLDRARDLLDRGCRRAPVLAPVLTSANRVLAGVAGAVEHLGPVQCGEHPATRQGRTAP